SLARRVRGGEGVGGDQGGGGKEGIGGGGPMGGWLASKRHQAEAEGVGLVGGLFDEGYGIVSPQSADRRIPGQADADRSARSGRVTRQARQRGRRSVDPPQGSGVREHGAAQPQILRHAGELEQQLRRGGIEHLTAERV